MSNNKEKDEKPGMTVSFIGGLAYTLLLVMVIPVVCHVIIKPEVENIIGDTDFVWLSSSMIVTIIMLVCILIFTLIFGGGAILRKYGVVGVIALIVAYCIMGNPKGAILPVLLIIILYALGCGKDKSRK